MTCSPLFAHQVHLNKSSPISAKTISHLLTLPELSIPTTVRSLVTVSLTRFRNKVFTPRILAVSIRRAFHHQHAAGKKLT